MRRMKKSPRRRRWWIHQKAFQIHPWRQIMRLKLSDKSQHDAARDGRVRRYSGLCSTSFLTVATVACDTFALPSNGKETRSSCVKIKRRCQAGEHASSLDDGDVFLVRLELSSSLGVVELVRVKWVEAASVDLIRIKEKSTNHFTRVFLKKSNQSWMQLCKLTCQLYLLTEYSTHPPCSYDWVCTGLLNVELWGSRISAMTSDPG